jgi:hypothetical protein
MLAILVGVTIARASTTALTIEVDEAQNVTVSGSSDSLRAAIGEICRLANVRLVAYDADDRPFAAQYRRVPLSEALARLLRSEIYLAGLRPLHGAALSQVTWLRVTGSNGGSAGAAFADLHGTSDATGNVAAAVAVIDLGVAPKVIETALESTDAGARNSARRAVVEALRSDRSALHRYLERDGAELVDQLVDFPHAAELLQSIETLADDSSERTVLRGVTHALRARQEAERRKAERAGEAPE